MDIIYISIISALTAAIIIRRHIRRDKLQKCYIPDQDESLDRSCLMLTIQPCRSIIDKALECISSYDDLAVCRNHRLGSEILNDLGKKIKEYSDNDKGTVNVPTVYYSNMLEATERIAETSRHIITVPGSCMPISYKCEIETIRRSLDRLIQSTCTILNSDKTAEGLRDEISMDKDFIEYTIEVHSKGMSYDEFDDDVPAYTYLMLLYYLHAFISSFSHIVKKIEIQNNI